MNQICKNVQSTKWAPLESFVSTELKGKEVHVIYVKVYDARETTFSDQTGQFPTRSKQGNKYIMVMVEVDNNAILVESLKSCKDSKLICGYKSLLLRLQRAKIVPWKNVMDNKISKAMKEHIQDECKVKLGLVSPGCHR